MRNENYNLIKTLHSTLDDLWRIEKFYLRDAKKAKCPGCQKAYATIQKDIKRHINMLTEELGNHIGKKKFK